MFDINFGKDRKRVGIIVTNYIIHDFPIIDKSYIHSERSTIVLLKFKPEN
jgi:hypothetical protein